MLPPDFFDAFTLRFIIGTALLVFGIGWFLLSWFMASRGI